MEAQKMIDFNFADAILEYRNLRAEKEATEARHKEELKPIKDQMEMLEGMMLDNLNKSGQKNASTDNGTAMRKTVVSTTCADPSAFFDFVRENEEWDLIERRPSKTAVIDYVEKHKEVPPGVNYTQLVKVEVRAPLKASLKVVK
jgi:hypothetical protein